MTKLKFMAEPPMDPTLMTCPHCGEEERIEIHQASERRYKCHECGKTFAETQGTLFAGPCYPIWLVVAVLTLMAHGCPEAAIVAAFGIDARTLRAWPAKADAHARRVQEALVCRGQVEPGQVQADELRVKIQGGIVRHPGGTRTAMSVFSRLWLWSELSPHRDGKPVRRLMDQVRQAALRATQPILVAVDGCAAYPQAIRAALHTRLSSGGIER